MRGGGEEVRSGQLRYEIEAGHCWRSRRRTGTSQHCQWGQLISPSPDARPFDPMWEKEGVLRLGGHVENGTRDGGRHRRGRGGSVGDGCEESEVSEKKLEGGKGEKKQKMLRRKCATADTSGSWEVVQRSNGGLGREGFHVNNSTAAFHVSPSPISLRQAEKL